MMGEAADNDSVSCSTVWRDFRREINGKNEQFWIGTLLENQVETALKHLCEYFSKDEPIAKALRLNVNVSCQNLGRNIEWHIHMMKAKPYVRVLGQLDLVFFEFLAELYEDEECVLFTREYWRYVLQQKVSLACFKKLKNGENELVAISVCRIKPKDSPNLLKEGMNEKAKKVFGLFQFIYDSKDAFEEFRVDECLVGSGLLTLPKYRGYNIGLEMLHARKPLCASLGLKLSITIFTAPASQRLAEKAGFKDFTSFTYDEIGKKNPEFEIPNIEAEFIRLMYILY